jgi:hypothetical protein
VLVTQDTIVISVHNGVDLITYDLTGEEVNRNAGATSAIGEVSFRPGTNCAGMGAIRVYNRALTQQEIQYLATKFRLGKYSDIEP